MEMIDVLTKLREIAETKPELVKDAVDNVERTNPKSAVTEGGMKDLLHDEAEKMSRKEFIAKHGESLAGFWDSINGTEEAVEGKIPAGLKAYQDKKAGKEDKSDKKETVKEAVQISTDTPEEASMMMQLLKLAGVQQVDQDMINQEPTAEPEADAGHGCGPSCAEHGCNCEHGQQDDEMGSQEMGRMRDMMTAPAEEKAEETFDNEPEEKVSDIDTLVNVHSGGLNRKKQAFAKAQDGDNAMAVAKEDTVTADDLANSFREQYEAFKEAYQKEATIAEAKPDFLDMDKDGDKKEPMKKAIKDKEAK
tara:strand:+ start:480 stop:1397 length:918 start_codon:yes stop_codon:yes gene_type:complete